MGYKLSKDTPPMEAALRYLLGDLCVEWGFCIHPEMHEKIAKSTSITADEFAVAVLEGDGMKAEYEAKWRKKIAGRFRERFGDDWIDEETFSDEEMES